MDDAPRLTLPTGLCALLGVLALTATACTSDTEAATSDSEVSPLDGYLSARLAETPPPDRLELLEPFAQAVAEHEGLQATFICTHNSRRSHLSQIWAQVGAWHFGLDDAQTFSGGTESTAFNPRAVAALERAGLEVHTADQRSDNPVYEVRCHDQHPVIECFSKCFSDPTNPQTDFAAVMTCSDTDESCPEVPGAALRFPIPYVDPKVSDGTPEEAATYDARCAQIAREMLWVMKRAAQLRGS